jgi:putative ABC transport system ATP-binding protein
MIQHAVSNTILCEGLSKTYGSRAAQVRAVSEIDLVIKRGTLTILAGPSGCGKTTLLSLVAGLLAPTTGTVSILGQRLDRLSDRGRTRFRRRQMGFVAQHHNLLPTLSAAENAAVPLTITGWFKRRALDKARGALEQVGLADRSDALPCQLSGGQQQRVGIARAIVHEPPVVVCDEPTSALDHETGRRVMQTLSEIASFQQRTVLVVTHDVRMFEFADRIVHMDDGRILEVQA